MVWRSQKSETGNGLTDHIDFSPAWMAMAAPPARFARIGRKLGKTGDTEFGNGANRAKPACPPSQMCAMFSVGMSPGLNSQLLNSIS